MILRMQILSQLVSIGLLIWRSMHQKIVKKYSVGLSVTLKTCGKLNGVKLRNLRVKKGWNTLKCRIRLDKVLIRCLTRWLKKSINRKWLSKDRKLISCLDWKEGTGQDQARDKMWC